MYNFDLSYKTKKEHQSSIREWLIPEEFENPLAVTLSMKQAQYFGRYRVALDEYLASKNLKHFLNKLNEKIFGRVFRRYKKQIKVFAVREGSINKRQHYHLVVDIPNGRDINSIKAFFSSEWELTEWGYNQVDVQEMKDVGWIYYITKLEDKIDLSENIDWNNCHK